MDLVLTGGGVGELESKAQKLGFQFEYMSPPPTNPDPDTQLMLLRL